ncbi:MAG: right-handed parallel beta-helix repeat-containing protein, partial [Candidatus Binatia bacterium]
MRPTLRLIVIVFLITLLSASSPVLAHSERQTNSPPRSGPVPDSGREPTMILDVCKTGGCDHDHIQAAVNAAQVGALIRIWPGFYREEPSREAPSLDPDGGDGTYTFQHHVDHPNSQNLIAIAGKKNITLRGMGACPRDVVVDAEFKKHVVIRGDRADGLIIENLSAWHGFDHGVYVLDTDGFLLDRVHSGFSREYPFLTFANDWGRMTDCEAFGGVDAGIYPGGSADTQGRPSMEVAHCKSYENVLGYSGSNGDHVWVHHTEFYNNAIGFVSDSLTDHPNYPQNNLEFEDNLVYDNNLPVYGTNANIKPTVFANSILIPIGVGVFLASGNENTVQNNQIWGNERYGVWLASGEGMVIGPTSEPREPPFMSSGNHFIANRMYAPPISPAGESTGGAFQPSSEPNRIDFAWDGMGWGNCWEGNSRDGSGAATTSDHPALPPCHDPILGTLM